MADTTRYRWLLRHGKQIRRFHMRAILIAARSSLRWRSTRERDTQLFRIQSLLWLYR